MTEPDALAASARRPRLVTILAVLAAVAGVLGVLGVILGALIHGLVGLNAIEWIIVLGALALSVLLLAVAYGAWRLERWAWTLGVIAGVAGLLYVIAVLIRGWSDLMVDAPALAVIAVLVAAIGAAGLFLWFRPEVRAAFTSP